MPAVRSNRSALLHTSRQQSSQPTAPNLRRRLTAQARHEADGGSQRRQPRPENVEGSFYVDHTCIDCDTCRWMAPASFTREGDMSAVTRQPEGEAQRQAAMQALLSCPTFSIHVRERDRGELRAAQQSFPLPVEGCANVYHCGFHSEHSFGATSYFIQRPQGNIMVDVPRWTPLLAQRLEQLGGVRWIFLTHRDDVSDHAQWAAHFGAERIIHRSEANQRQGTDKCEVQLEGGGPWTLPGPASSSTAKDPSSAATNNSDDVELIATPGHTAGCVSLLYRPSRALFTGDHLAYSHRLQRLSIFRAYNWHSVSKQLDSVAKLSNLDFVHLLPGHGRRTSFADAADRERQLQAVLEAEGYVAVPAA
ncbi:hypothetical protein D9Q98_005182 [Chlorella vulgaris]|uniref:Metallo-beta-lactamase domain-containing protein n=1 Tax=Chlorella vulgaris TaxID=3077 RepID=A0A9D4YXE8_CHLVU|nr:hypothetical protein D9Q98_005182 [Chlorella vulgaris]